MKKELLLILILTICICVLGFAGESPKSAKPNSLLIAGKITDQTTNEFLAGVKIVCSTYGKTVYSDLEGNFFIYLELTTNKNLSLEFSQIGYSPKTFKTEEVQGIPGNLSVTLIAE